ncbi:major facilitator superfamily domain-containing protein [Xylariomycetidae sp. FL2044]|nr:major facilitator superfamily domain-containing protein [Xylariomycetidae sp. FL2044]
MPDDEGGSGSQDEYPPWRTVAAVMVALYLAMFLVALDRIIISTAVPKITDEFHSIRDIGWYGSAYVFTGCVTQLLFGRLYLFYDNKLVFLAAVVLFEAGSALCGAAPTSTAFILGRAIAGCGSSGVFSGTIVIMIPMAPLEKRPMYQGMLGAVFGVSSVVGPLIGGAFTSNAHLTWRWCFYVNLPIGAVSVLLVLLFLRLSPPRQARLPWRQKLLRMDPVGNALFAPSVICLLLALQWGGSDYAWGDGRIIALLVLFVVLLAAWVATQAWQKEKATVPPHVFLQRSIMAGVSYSACIGGVMLSMGYYLPIWFQAIDGVDALQSGIRGLPFILALVLSSMMAGGFVTKVGYYTPCVILCSVLMTPGAGLLTTLRVDSGNAEWIGYQVLAGFGMGLGMQQSGLAAQVVLAHDDVPIGASLMFFGQQLGGAVFLCAAQNVFLQELVEDLTSVIPRESASALSRVGATELRDHVPSDLLPAVLVQYNKALTTTFYVGTAIAAVSIVPALLFEWKSVKGHGKGTHDREVVETGAKVRTSTKE